MTDLQEVDRNRTAEAARPDAAPEPTDLLGRFDAVVEPLFDRLRGNPAVDASAALISNLADYGFVWAVLAAVKGRRAGPGRARATRSLAIAGVTSATTNRLVKEVVRRERPEVVAERPAPGGPVPVRSPSSSSFPSGHTLAAFCTALVLADTPAETAAYVGFAGAVAVSRVHLGAHHPSDVVGGAVIGSALGWAVRAVRRGR